MITTFLKIVIRSFNKSKGLSTLNILGLSLGIGSFLLIGYYCYHELKFDSFWNRSESIYRINFINGNGEEFAITPSGLAWHLKSEIPEIETVARIDVPYSVENTVSVQISDREFFEHTVALVDSSFLTLFPINILYTNGSKLLSLPTDIIITESQSKKYFGNESAIGRMLRIAQRDYRVQAVCEDFPSNTHFNFSILIPLHSNPEVLNVWQWWNVNTYVKLSEKANVADAATKTKSLLKKYAGSNYSDFWQSFTFVYQPLLEMHFAHSIQYDISKPVSRLQLFILGGIALSILILASFNFVNLAIARLSERVKEISVGKVLGANPSRLITQQIIEATVVCLISGVLSLLIIFFIYPIYQELTGIVLPKSFSFFSVAALFLVALSFALGTACAIYPALLLLDLNISEVLKNDSAVRMKGARFRGVMLGFQFFITAFLIIATYVASSQFDFLISNSPGFNKDQLVAIRLRDFTDDQKSSFKTQIKNLASIDGVSLGSHPIGTELGMWVFWAEGMSRNSSQGATNFMTVDEDFLDVMNIQLARRKKFQFCLRSE